MSPAEPEKDKTAEPSEDGRKPGQSKPVPTWLLIFMTLCAGILTPLFAVSVAEEQAWSATVQGRLLPGGETVRVVNYQSSDDIDCKGRVAYTVDGGYYEAAEQVGDIECDPNKEQAVTVRYNPDDPYSFETDGRDWGVYFFLVVSSIASLGLVVSWADRLRKRLTRRRVRG